MYVWSHKHSIETLIHIICCSTVLVLQIVRGSVLLPHIIFFSVIFTFQSRGPFVSYRTKERLKFYEKLFLSIRNIQTVTTLINNSFRLIKQKKNIVKWLYSFKGHYSLFKSSNARCMRKENTYKSRKHFQIKLRYHIVQF